MVIRNRFSIFAAAMALLISGCISMPKYSFVDPATVVASNVQVSMEAWVYQKSINDDFYVVENAKAKELKAFITFNQNYFTLNWGMKGSNTKNYTLWYKEDLSADYLQQKNLQIISVEALCLYEDGKKGLEIYSWPFEVIVTLKDGSGDTYKVRWVPDGYDFERR